MQRSFHCWRVIQCLALLLLVVQECEREKAGTLAKIPDSTGAEAGPCESGASDDPEKDHYCGRATDYSNGLDPS